MTPEAVIAGDARWCVSHSDCLDLLRGLPDRCVDAIVTDPPAGIAFMNAEWDKDKGGRDPWIAWLASVFVELRRVAKPGAHALVWALPRTSHWTATAMENAGWEIRDRLAHLYANRMHKGKNLGGGVGSALKPACEDWWLARAPIEGTLSENHNRWGTGGLNIDLCRIGYDRDVANAASNPLFRKLAGYKNGNASDHNSTSFSMKDGSGERSPNPAGRAPANVILSHATECSEVTCAQDCPLRCIDIETDSADVGGTSRFFFAARPTKAERGDNRHPTVKPLSLMSWLCRLVVPANGIVVDPFCGSGTTVVASLAEGFRCIGIEQDAQFFATATKRARAAHTVYSPETPQ